MMIRCEAPAPTACFSKNNFVHVQGKGAVAIDRVSVGDYVRVDDDLYAPVSTLGHKEEDTMAKFVRLEVQAEEDLDPIELTANHLVLAVTSGKRKMTPAGDIRVGDDLVCANGSLASVVGVDSVNRRGVYAPFTTSGRIVVNGVVASTYANPLGFEPPISFQWMAHTALSPHRLACMINWQSCKDESFSQEGVSNWFWLYMWLLKQSPIVFVPILASMLPFLTVIRMMEGIVNLAVHASGLYFAMFAAGCLVAMKLPFWKNSSAKTLHK